MQKRERGGKKRLAVAQTMFWLKVQGNELSNCLLCAVVFKAIVQLDH